MSRRSRGNATVMASEPWRAVPVDGGRRVVEIRVGPSDQTQDGCQTIESLRKYRGRRASSSNVAEGQRQRILQCNIATIVEEGRHPSFFHVGRRQDIDRRTV